MAKIDVVPSYPLKVTPAATDTLIGSDNAAAGTTKQFEVGAIVAPSLAAAATAQSTANTGVANAATAQAAAVAALARANHTGTQLAATISDFATGVSGALQVGMGLFVASGLATDGTGDNTAAILAAIAAIQAAGGGELRLPYGTLRCDGQLLIPNDGGGLPKQKPLIVSGAGASKQSTAGSGTPNGGTILDLRYAGAGVAKIDTRGMGHLTIRDLTITDKSATPNTVPFIQTTNTVLQIQNVAFYGNPARGGVTCDQDAIVLGGVDTTGDGTDDAPFQGYGTVIKDCFFDRIRRCVYGRTYANAIVVRDNTIWNQCGSNLADGAAIEFVGLSGQVCSGNIIEGNCIEVVRYPYAVKLANATMHTLGPNGIFDASAGASHLAAYRFEDGAVYNEVRDGYRADAYPLISESVAAANTNTTRTAHQTQPSRHAQPAHFHGPLRALLGSGVGAVAYATMGDQGYLLVAAGNNPYPVLTLVAIPAVQFTDGVTTNGSTTVTSATAAFAATDVGLPIGGTGIPSNTYIARRNSATSVELSKNCTVTNTGVTINIGRSTGTAISGPSFARHHILSTGSTPSGAVDAAGGSASGGTITPAGTDLAGSFTLTTGSGVTNGSAGTPVELCHLAWAINHTVAPRVALTPRNVGAAQLMLAGCYVVTTTSQLQLWCIGTVPVSTACIFDYHTIQ